MITIDLQIKVWMPILKFPAYLLKIIHMSITLFKKYLLQIANEITLMKLNKF